MGSEREHTDIKTGQGEKSKKNELLALQNMSDDQRRADPALDTLFDMLFTDHLDLEGTNLAARIRELKDLYMHVSRRARVCAELLDTKEKTKELREMKGDKESTDIIDEERRRTSERELKSMADVFHVSSEAYAGAIAQLDADPEEFTLQALLHFRKKIAKKWGDAMIQMEYAEGFPPREIVQRIIADRIRLKKKELQPLQEKLKTAEDQRIVGIVSEDLYKRENEYIKAAKTESYVRREITALEEYLESINAT